MSNENRKYLVKMLAVGIISGVISFLLILTWAKGGFVILSEDEKAEAFCTRVLVEAGIHPSNIKTSNGECNLVW